MNFVKNITDESWKKIKLVLLDVDGVLTNNQIIYSSSGDELKIFSVKDGRGILEAEDLGLEFGIITARKSIMVERRALDLKIKYLYQNCKDKLKIFEEILDITGYSPENIMFIGDDIIDLPVMINAGISATVADCASSLEGYYHYKSSKNGGCGAVREILEFLLKKQDKLEILRQKYLKK